MAILELEKIKLRAEIKSKYIRNIALRRAKELKKKAKVIARKISVLDQPNSSCKGMTKTPSIPTANWPGAAE